MALSGIQLSAGILVGVNSSIDAKYGPYPDTITAKDDIGSTLRYLGLTVGIITGGVVTEYWWKNGIGNDDLIPKVLGGTLNSVGLTMPSAFTVINSPLTTDGTLIVSGAGTISQYIRGNGTLATLPVTPTFTGPLTVSLSGGKTFGKYKNLDVIPATGKTAAEVIQLAIVEALDPILTLSSPTTIAFNQVIISNVLNFSYIIKSLDGVVATVSLEWKRAGSPANGGTDDLWVVLSTNTAITTFTHPAPNNSAFNTNVYNYRYIVTDDKGGTATALLNITPAAYVAPTIQLTAIATTKTAPETDTLRETGNISTNLSGNIIRNSANVPMTSYTLQYSVNNLTWFDIGSSVPLSGASQAITPVTHNDPTLFNATIIYYRVKFIDTYQTFQASFIVGGLNTIVFRYFIFYGPSATRPETSSDVRALGNRGFTPTTSLSNPFNLNTGTVQRIFTVAMPSPLTITSVIDLDALNANITLDYTNPNPIPQEPPPPLPPPFRTISVADAYGTLVTYNVYTMTTGVPYSPTSHRHQITRV